MLKFKEFKDFGSGLCAVFTTVWPQQEIRLNKKNLELRIKNLKKENLDYSTEQATLIKLNERLTESED